MSETINTSGADDFSKMTASVDRLVASLDKLAAKDSAMLQLSKQMQSLQTTMVTGFTEMAAIAQRKESEREASRKTALERQVALENAHFERLHAQANKFHDRRIEQDAAAENKRAATLQGLIEKRALEEFRLKTSADREYTNWWAAELAARTKLEEAAQAASWQNFLKIEAAKVAEKKRSTDAQAAEAARLVKLEEASQAASWQNFLRLEASKVSAAERMRRLDTSFMTSSLPGQIKTAEQAAVYSSLGGNAAQRYGNAAATADLAALRAQYAAMPSAVNPSRAAILAHNEAMNEGHALARGFAGSLGGLWLTYGSLVPLLAGAAIASSLKNIVEVGKEVEHQLNFVAALSGQKVDLNEFLAVSSNTVVSVKDAAEGMRALAQSGLDAQQSLRALPTVLNLAVIGEMSVGAAALSATGAVQAFGLSMDNIGRVGDVFAQVAAQSNTSVALLNESMKQASTVAQVYNVSLEETGAALGVLAKQNITGSAAGTAYTNMLTGLYSPTRQAAGALKMLGIQTQENDGSLKNSTKLIGELRVALSQFNPSAQADIINDIFTNRGAKAFAAIAENIGLYTQGINNATNSTGMMSKAVMKLEDDTEGAFRRLKNTVSGTFNKSFADAQPALQALIDQMTHLAASTDAQRVLTNLTNGALSLTKAFLDNIQVIGLMVAAYAGFALVRSTMTAVTASLAAYDAALLKSGTATLAFSATARTALGILGPIALALTVASTAWAIYTSAVDKQESSDQRLRNSLSSNIDFLNRETEALQKNNRELDRKAGIKAPETTDGQKLQASLEAQLASARAQLKVGGSDAQQLATSARIVKLEDDLRVARKQAFEEEQAQGMHRMAMSANEARIAKQNITQQIEDLQRKGAIETTIDGKKVAVDPLGNAASQAIANGERLKTLLAGVKAGTIDVKQAQTELTDIQREYNSTLQGTPDKPDRKGQADTYRAASETLRLEKELLQVRQATAALQDSVANKGGRLDDLTLLERQAARQRELIQATLGEAQAQINLADTQENKRAATARFKVAQERSKEELKQLDLRTELERQALFDRFGQENLQMQADNLAARGDIEEAALVRFRMQYGRALDGANAIMVKTQKDLSDAVASGASSEVLTKLRERNRIITEYVELLGKVEENSGAKAQFDAARTQLDTLLGQINGRLSEAQANSTEEGGLSGALGLGTAAANLRDGLLPQVRELQDRLQQIAKTSGLAELTKGAAEADAKVGTTVKNLTKAANPFGDAWKDVWKTMERGAHDAWMKIGKDGSSVFVQLRDTLRDTIMEMLYQMTIKKWMINIGASFGEAGGLAGLFSGGGAAGGGAAGGMGALSGAMSLVNGAKNLYSAITGGGLATIGNGLASIGTKLGIQSLEGFGMGMQGVGSQAGSTALSMNMPGAQAGQMFGSAAGVAAGVAGGVFGGRMISGGYGTFGSGNGTVNAGTAIGAAIGSIVPVLGTALGALIGGLAGGAVNRLFGRKAPEIESQGIRGTLTDSMVSGETYQNIVEKGGLFRSSKRYTNTQTLSSEYANSLSDGFISLKAVTEGYAKTLGVSTQVLAGYTKNFDIKFDDKLRAAEKNYFELQAKADSGDQGALAQVGGAKQEYLNQMTSVLTKLFTDVGDELATRLIPNMQDFAKVGESASATLQRLASDFQATETIAQLLGKTGAQAFGASGLDSVKARENFINQSGGLDALSSQLTSYAQNYLSEAEKAAPVLKALDAAFKELNVKAPTTRDEFKALVTGLDLTKTEDIKLFNSLMNLQDAFAQVHSAAENTAAAVKSAAQILEERKGLMAQLDGLMPKSDQLAQQRALLDPSNRALFDEIQARTALKQAYESERTALEQVIDRTESFAKGLKAFYNGLVLGDKSPLTPEQRYQEAKSQYEQTLALAMTGDETAQTNYQTAAEAFLEASKVANASSSTYLEDFARVRSATSEALTWAERQVNIEKASLVALDKQVEKLIEIEAHTLTMAEALKALAGATLGTPRAGPVNEASITQMYKDLLGRTPDSGGLQFWMNAANSGNSLQYIEDQIRQSAEYQQKHTTLAETQLAVDSDVAFYAAQDVRLAEDSNRFLQGLLEQNAKLLKELEKAREEARENAAALAEATVEASAANAETVATATASAVAQAAFDRRVKPE